MGILVPFAAFPLLMAMERLETALLRRQEDQAVTGIAVSPH
jgi:hypothetical protein